MATKSLQELRDTVAHNLTDALRDSDMTQKDLAERMRVGQATVSNWCKGIKKPRTETLVEISELLHVPMNYLIGVGPFEHWTGIQKDLRGFFDAVSKEWSASQVHDVASTLYSINLRAPNSAKLSDITYFINDNFSRIEPLDSGWKILSTIKETPAPAAEDKRSKILLMFDQLSPAKQTELLELADFYLAQQRKTQES